MKEVRGCGMRSAVGFLSRRMIGGQPQLKEDFQRRRLDGCSSLYKKDMLGHFGCVNAIEFSNNGGQWLVSGKILRFCTLILLMWVSERKTDRSRQQARGIKHALTGLFWHLQFVRLYMHVLFFCALPKNRFQSFCQYYINMLRVHSV